MHDPHGHGHGPGHGHGHGPRSRSRPRSCLASHLGVISRLMRVFQKIIFIALFITACAGSQKEVLVRPGPVLIVENRTDEALDCFADGWYLGTVKPGAQENFGNMRVRKQKITARGLTTGKDYWTIADLAGKDRVVWKVSPLKKAGQGTSPYIINVKNQQVMPVDVYIDGKQRDSIAAEATARFAMAIPGAHRVVVKTGDIKRYFNVYVQKGVSPVIDIAASKIIVRVQNPEKEGVFAVLDKGDARLVPAGRDLAFRGVSAGKHRIRFVSVSGKACGDFEIQAVAGVEVNVEPKCPKADLMVINETSVELEIRLGGGTIATCQSNGAVDVGNIPAGTLHLTAWDGRQLIAKAVRTAHPGQKVLWMVSKGAGVVGNERFGTMVVYNRTGKDLQLWVDRINRGIVRRDRNLLLTSMTPGDHMVNAYCPVTGTTWSAVMHYDGNERLKWTVNAALGSARVRNMWAEPVVLLVDGTHSFKLKTGETREIALPVGRHTFETNGKEVELSDKVNVSIEVGQMTLVKLIKPLGTVVVHNVAARPLEVLLDDRMIGVLNPNGEVKLGPMRAGRHKIVARDVKSKARWLDSVKVIKGQSIKVEIGK